jgi:hypothetical protein
MPTETAQPASKTELERLLRREFLKRPSLGHCHLLAIGFFVGGCMLNFFLAGQALLSTRYLIIAAVYFIGAVAGICGFFYAPRFLRSRQVLLLSAALANTIFLFAFGYRALVLLQLPSP